MAADDAALDLGGALEDAQNAGVAHIALQRQAAREAIPAMDLQRHVTDEVRGFRGETETLDKMAGRVRCDHEYIRHWSLWMDLRILAETFLVVLRQKNAY